MAEKRDVDRLVADEREDRHMVHVHGFNTLTYIADGHQHCLMGVSGPARPTASSHVHRIRVRTTFHAEDEKRGHWHWFDMMTGPAVFVADSEHIHCYQGVTSIDDGHNHEVASATIQAPDIQCVAENPPLPPPSPPAAAPVAHKQKNKPMKRS